jgi:hypothetical protein
MKQLITTKLIWKKEVPSFLWKLMYFEFVLLNERESCKLCEELVSCATEQLKHKLSSNNYDYKKFVLDSQHAFATFDNNAIGPAFLTCRENLKQFITIQEDLVKKLEGYSEEIEIKLHEQQEKHFKELEEVKQKNLDNNLLKQMLEDNAQAVQMFLNNQHQALKRMQEDSERNAEEQKKQFQVILQTQGQEAIIQFEKIREQMNNQQTNLFESIKQQDQINVANIEQMVRALKEIPPPQPVVGK